MQSNGSSRWCARQKPKFWWHILECIPCLMLLSKTWIYVEMAYSSWKITKSAPLLSSLACNRKWNFVAKAWTFWRQKEELFSWAAQVFCKQRRNICSWCAQVFCNRKKKNLELKCWRFCSRKKNLELEQLSILQQEEEIRAELLELFANKKKKNF